MRSGAKPRSPPRRAVLRCACCLSLRCSAACGGHVNAPSEPMVAEAHVDRHGMATMEATEDAEEAHAEANAAADECCDATDSTRPSERGDMLPAAVALLTSAESLWTERASPTRARPPPSGQGRSPGRTLLLLIVSFLGIDPVSTRGRTTAARVLYRSSPRLFDMYTCFRRHRVTGRSAAMSAPRTAMLVTMLLGAHAPMQRLSRLSRPSVSPSRATPVSWHAARKRTLCARTLLPMANSIPSSPLQPQLPRGQLRFRSGADHPAPRRHPAASARWRGTLGAQRSDAVARRRHGRGRPAASPQRAARSTPRHDRARQATGRGTRTTDVGGAARGTRAGVPGGLSPRARRTTGCTARPARAAAARSARSERAREAAKATLERWGRCGSAQSRLPATATGAGQGGEATRSRRIHGCGCSTR